MDWEEVSLPVIEKVSIAVVNNDEIEEESNVADITINSTDEPPISNDCKKSP